jgi:hypothetical protein
MLFALLLTLSTEQWLQDFRFLLTEISSHYANLDSAIEDRRLDLTAIRKRAEERIRAAKDDADAQRAIDSFMNAFGDGHAHVRWDTPSSGAVTTEPPAPLCRRLGYASRDFGGIDFSRLDGYRPTVDADSAIVPGGLLDGRFGIIRIHNFSERVHPTLCESVAASLELSADATCEGDCPWRVHQSAANLLTGALERRIESLRKAGASVLVVDITRNGGGSDWVEPAARVLTPLPLKASRIAFIRHPHWVRILEQRRDDVRNDESAVGRLSRASEEARKPCDRSGLWSDPPKKPDCSMLVVSDFFATGLRAYAKPSSLDGVAGANVYFNPVEFRYREGANRLPLIVLVDGGTGSAAEYFAAMLQDNQAAQIAGLPTRGAGCGHTNGGIFVNLPNSGGRLALPDCARLRADGSNEVLGVTPGTLIPWRDHDSAYLRAAKARSALIGMTARR